ncbi:MAG: alpha/beta fold hydrolase [Caldilineae bacterium]|nr:MAG: alpha/beta fold hydrolase [Caldilineae bacterium]
MMMPSANILSPESFFLPGGPVGALLIHGFTGAATEMRMIGDYLHARGLTVYGPLLPGHGTSPEEMNRCRWQDWTKATEEAYTHLKRHCREVVVGGLSMGSLLTLYLAAEHPELPGIVLYSPAVKVAQGWLLWLTPLVKHLTPFLRKGGDTDLVDPEAEKRLWHYDVQPLWAADELRKLIVRVRHRLPGITAPALIVHSTRDRAIAADSARYTYERLGSTRKNLVTLHGSGHCLTVDAEWERVARLTYEFVCATVPGAEHAAQNDG